MKPSVIRFATTHLEVLYVLVNLVMCSEMTFVKVRTLYLVGCAIMQLIKNVDIDECSGVNPCQQGCTNTQGSFMCSCEDGFLLDDDGSTCNRKELNLSSRT